MERWHIGFIAPFHLYTDMGGVQFPTRYNEMFRAFVWSHHKPKNVMHKDFPTFKQALEWHVTAFVARYVVWC